ncbi:MAG: beta galactosidase jelly roll domain-containing protein [Flavobacteriales bacterium]|nr:beta galactosidase jelly roll domain-containing protein [Flavobacteriales bacterium]
MSKNIYIHLLLIAITSLQFSSCSNTTKSSNTIETTSLERDWTIINSSKTDDKGDLISSTNYELQEWQKAKVPATILANLVENGVYTDIFKDQNFDKIDKEQFKTSWWYRKSFKINKSEKSNYNLIFEGINYRANIWLNGKQIAKASDIESPYRMFTFNVSAMFVEGENVLAVEVFPPAKDDLTIGFVDWNPEPSDRNMGIWRPVLIVETGKVALKNPVINSKVNLETLASAELTINSDIVNYGNKDQKVTINGSIDEIKFSKEINIIANSTTKVEFNSKEFSQLIISNPKLWWPNGLGDANLYNLELTVSNANTISDNHNIRFGIRDIEEYVNEQGHKGWMVNGKKVLIKGAGWVDDILLNDDDQKVIDQLEYVKHMNLNTVRLEGFWGKNKTLFDQCDELGLLVMIGWSCQWEWQDYCGREELDTFMSVTTDHDIEVQTQGYADQVTWLRNHPSVFMWVFGSDKLPITKLEKKLNETITELDGTRPILSSCKAQISEITGPSRVKMEGPYGYVTPNYWYIDKQFGGAFGFNTETGPGPQIPPLESLKKMLSEDKLWPMGEDWKYHLGRNEFHTLDRYIKAFDARYGKSNSVEDFARVSQISNYEAIRPMFEAFAVNKGEATGVIQWMLNSAWPEMFWQLYDYYLMPTGAFYGTMKSAQTVNIIYNYGDKAIYLTNEKFETQKSMTSEIKVFDINSKELLSKTIKSDIAENSSSKIFDIPNLKNLTTTYFVHVSLKDSENNEVANQIYWLSTGVDTFDWDKTTFVNSPNKDFGSLRGLRTMPKSDVNKKVLYKDEGNKTIVSVELKNNSDKIAFFIEMQVNNSEKNESILPVFWDDNYVTLLPNETRTFTAKIAKTGHDNLNVKYN